MQLKTSTTRIVFVFNNFVLKFPNIKSWKQLLWGLLANMQEREFNKINHAALGCIYFSNIHGLFLIMEKADKILDIDELSFRKIMKIKYKNDDISKFILSDLKRDNFGYRRNTKEIIKIDYGN